MSESSVASARAAVNKYDPRTNSWIPGDSGISRVDLYHNISAVTYRVIAVDNRTSEFVVNSAITADVVFELASPVFAQWTDAFDSSYGLNFPNANDAKNFTAAVAKAVEHLKTKKVVVKASPVPPIDAPPPARAILDRSPAVSSPSLPSISSSASPKTQVKSAQSGPPPPSDVPPPPSDIPPPPSKRYEDRSTDNETEFSGVQLKGASSKSLSEEKNAQKTSTVPPILSPRSLPQTPPGEGLKGSTSPYVSNADPKLMKLPIANGPPPPGDVPAPPIPSAGHSRESSLSKAPNEPLSASAPPTNGVTPINKTPSSPRAQGLIPPRTTGLQSTSTPAASPSRTPPSQASNASSLASEKPSESSNTLSRPAPPSRGAFTKVAPPSQSSSRRGLPSPLTRSLTSPTGEVPTNTPPPSDAANPISPRRNAPKRGVNTPLSPRSGPLPALPRSPSPNKPSDISVKASSKSATSANFATAALTVPDVDLSKAVTVGDLVRFKKEMKEYIDQAKKEILDALNSK